jgi:hypothetical protein
MSPKSVEAFMRLAALSCFACHGIVALMNAYIPFSQWNVWLQQLMPWAGFSGAKYFLLSAGVIDILVAACFLRREVPKVAFAWAIGWGLATATSRLYFLGSFSAPFWTGVGHPLGEFLVRAGNWALPLLLFAAVSTPPAGNWLARLKRLGDSRGPLIYIVAVATTLGLVLHYVVEANYAVFPINVLRMGMPLWLFHLSGTLPSLALLGLIFVPKSTFSARLPLACYVIAELLAVYFFHRHVGIGYSLLQLGEHASVFLCLFLLAAGDVKATVKLPAHSTVLPKHGGNNDESLEIRAS